jgi:hypothetical protein
VRVGLRIQREDRRWNSEGHYAERDVVAYCLMIFTTISKKDGRKD